MSNIETKSLAVKRRCTYLSKTVAPPTLEQSTRLVIFQHLTSLLTLLPAGLWTHFDVLRSQSKKLKQKCAPTNPEVPSRIVFNKLKTERMLTECPYAAAICTPFPNSNSEHEHRYRRYQILVIMSCLKLYLVGQHNSAIENALREIRLIATDLDHIPLLTQLPSFDDDTSMLELFSSMREKRNDLRSALLKRGMSFLYIVIYDAYRMSKGITRRRESEFKPQVDHHIEFIPLEATDETDLSVRQLEITSHTNTVELQDESLLVRSGKVICVVEGNTPHQSQAIKVIQGKRLAEALSIRQLALPCSIEQSSDYDIQQLISCSVEALTIHNEHFLSAAWLVFSLVSGRNPEAFNRNPAVRSQLKLLREVPCLVIQHNVPATTQSSDYAHLLNDVVPNLILPIPSFLSILISTKKMDPEELSTFIQYINYRHQTRLTLGRIIRYLEFWFINQGMDRAEIALIRGETSKSRPALAYSNLDADAIISHHNQYIRHIFKLAKIDLQLPKLRPTQKTLGSRLNLPSPLLHNLFKLLSTPARPNHKAQLDEFIRFHNYYICYVWALLAFSTGHRDVTAPMGRLSDFNPSQNTWWISDKEIRHGLSARTVIIPPIAAQQTEHYLEHLRTLSQRCRFSAPILAARCQTALDSSQNLLFAVYCSNDGQINTTDLSPSQLNILLNNKLPWAHNWPRHHLRSELKRNNIAPSHIDGWMGHEEIGEEMFGRYSVLSMSDMHHIANTIELILKKHLIEALPGCQTH
tara:strand:- start:8318 stop:10570 length:2253 start_codon:yes stop_codon:yes gene_type:complete